MKKILVLIMFSLLLIIPCNVFAAGGLSVSRTSINITKGGSASFTVTASNAVGRVDISTSNSSIASISTTTAWLENNSVTVTINGNTGGTAYIYVTPSDMATFDEEVITTQYVITVSVTSPAPAPTPIPTPTPAPSTPTDTRSKNANLKSLTVDGREVTNLNNTYNVEVSNYVTGVDIKAIAEDSKATVTGSGKQELVVGLNTFYVVVTAENGYSVTYSVLVNRKEFNSYSDFDDIVDSGGDSEIRIEDTDKVSKDDLNKLKDKKSTVTLTKVSDTNDTLYSWIINGNSVKFNGEFNPNISNKVDDLSKLEKAFNYAEGLYIDFSDCINVPEGIVLRYYVGSKYDNDEVVKLYTYGKDGKISQLKSDLVVKDGYVEFVVNDSNTHFISMTTVNNAIVVKEKSGFNIWMIISIVLIIVVIVLVIFLIKGKSTMNRGSKEVNLKPEIKEEKKIEVKQTEVKQSNVFADERTPISQPVVISAPKLEVAPVNPVTLTQVASVKQPIVQQPVPSIEVLNVEVKNDKEMVLKEETKEDSVLRPNIDPNKKEAPLAPVIDKNAQNVGVKTAEVKKENKIVNQKSSTKTSSNNVTKGTTTQEVKQPQNSQKKEQPIEIIVLEPGPIQNIHSGKARDVV